MNSKSFQSFHGTLVPSNTLGPNLIPIRRVKPANAPGLKGSLLKQPCRDSSTTPPK